ncbi:hypothetical protein PC116_g3639 [Phytophthora cactorum]|uniref:Uncharacterized protein n=1 Tax=Phytophthora cactorum TaxID=29920 RepID=A0A8T1LIK8_9STRA|nr:hypothetical protein PC114_g2009 [Phytophthora cactorum]KAG2953782.1 hypothetical protein PC117_g1767 [Phytophthora cactorum]KAG3038676.1 hypothetical protein PC119_g2757 [Phytophthora cactorum]KAG3191056.1 hypothetical protein C6341_g1398 [Phytophthora cactorum]KAG4058859.1 hypothetical protein PC123_g6208 [Phytophthora cactorum]
MSGVFLYRSSTRMKGSMWSSVVWDPSWSGDIESSRRRSTPPEVSTHTTPRRNA